MRSDKPREKPCPVCGRTIRKPYPSELARVETCGKRCEGERKRQQFAFSRLEHFTKKGLLTMTPVEAFRWGYRLGYFRRANIDHRTRLREKAA